MRDMLFCYCCILSTRTVLHMECVLHEYFLIELSKWVKCLDPFGLDGFLVLSIHYASLHSLLGGSLEVPRLTCCQIQMQFWFGQRDVPAWGLEGRESQSSSSEWWFQQMWVRRNQPATQHPVAAAILTVASTVSALWWQLWQCGLKTD